MTLVLVLTLQRGKGPAILIHLFVLRETENKKKEDPLQTMGWVSFTKVNPRRHLANEILLTIHYKDLQTHTKRIVWQTAREITNTILGVKALIRLVLNPAEIYFYSHQLVAK